MADEIIADDGIEQQAWPANGPHFNRWNENAAAFVKLVQENPGFWVCDFKLKYLDVRIDTRDGGFVLMDRDGARISPDAVVAAIGKHRERFGALSKAKEEDNG